MNSKIFNNNIIKKNLANQITLLRIILIPLFILVLLVDNTPRRYFAAIIFLILALSDMLDGYIARKYSIQSLAGAILDPLADKLLVGAALIFLIGKGVVPWMAYVIIARELIITALRTLALTSAVNKAKTNVSAKLSGKLKTLSQIVAILAILMYIPYASVLMLIATIITIYSGIEYLWIDRKVLKEIF